MTENFAGKATPATRRMSYANQIGYSFIMSVTQQSKKSISEAAAAASEARKKCRNADLRELPSRILNLSIEKVDRRRGGAAAWRLGMAKDLLLGGAAAAG